VLISPLSPAAHFRPAGTLQYIKLAFYLRCAAADVGVKALNRLNGPDKAAAGGFLGSLVEKLETDRAQYGISREDEDADLETIRQFALSVFGSADKMDRSGAANKETVRQYMGAGAYLEAVRILQPTAPAKLDSMVQYAKARATSILKDLKAGRQPAPPEGSSESDSGVFVQGVVSCLTPNASPFPFPLPLFTHPLTTRSADGH
jgi:hypothetical protein